MSDDGRISHIELNYVQRLRRQLRTETARVAELLKADKAAKHDIKKLMDSLNASEAKVAELEGQLERLEGGKEFAHKEHKMMMAYRNRNVRAESTVAELEAKVAELEAQVADQPEIKYQSKASGLWYTNPKSVGAINTITVNGIMFHLVGLEALEEVGDEQINHREKE